MDVYYTNASTSSAQLVIDNDSGYVSNYQESNSSVANELNHANDRMNGMNQSIYISEDALLEKPNLEEECVYDNDSDLVDASQSTETTNYSGFQDDIPSSTEKSIIIKKISPIEYKCDEDFSDTSLQQSMTMNDSSNISLSDSSFNTTASVEVSALDLQLTSFIAKQNALREALNQKEITITTPTKTYENHIDPNLSPELFSEEEDLDISHTSEIQLNTSYTENYIHKFDEILLKRVQRGMNGLLPPPSLKVVTLSVTDMLDRLELNKHLFLNQEQDKIKQNNLEVPKDNNTQTAHDAESELINHSNTSNVKHVPSNTTTRGALINCDLNEAKEDMWPNILLKRNHGLHHNRSKLSERFEDLCTKYTMRYVGGETQSTCTVFEINNPSSPSKRRNRLRWVAKSPGRRLSHLARRRITFSSANLQSNSRQILIDTKRMELLSRRKSPRKKSPRKTPRKSPRKSPRKRIRTPSSASKKLSENFDQSGPSTTSARASATKRALFESPQKDKLDTKHFLLPSVSKTGRSPFKKLTPKRALFTSPIKRSPTNDNKRKRVATTSENDERPAKFPRSISMIDGNKSRPEQVVQQQMARTRSETSILGLKSYQTELSELHKKKLQWAVYEALKTQKIGPQHPQYKTFACNLARVTRRFLPNLSSNAPRPEGCGTSERMLRIARQHVFAVSRGKSVDEIVRDVLENRAKLQQKPTGYVGLDDVERSIKDNKENIFHNANDLNGIVIGSDSNKSSNSDRKLSSNKALESRIDRVRKVINFDNDKRL